MIIQTVARRAGHLAPNLGVVELTLALHRVFDSPRDKIIWDVGHQSYPHKLVTGRLRPLRHAARSSAASPAIRVALGERARPVRHQPRQHVDLGRARLRGRARSRGREPSRRRGHRRRRAHRRHGVRGAQQRRRAGQAPDRHPQRQRVEHLAQHRRHRTATSPSSRPAACTARFERDVCELLGQHAAARRKRAAARGAASRKDCTTSSCRRCCSRSWVSSTSARSTATTSTCSRRRCRTSSASTGRCCSTSSPRRARATRRPRTTPCTFHGVGVFDPETGTASKSSKKTYTHVFGETALLDRASGSRTWSP